jgi:hypothetical protein
VNDEDIRDAAYDFMRKIGMDPTPDAVSQLSGPFATALQVMCTRRYNFEPGDELWRTKGWKGLVHDILNKAGRIKYHSWRHNNFDADSAIDIINFSGFYWRLENQGSKWGELGEPG